MLNSQIEELNQKTQKMDFVKDNHLNDLINDFSAFLIAKKWTGYSYEPKLHFEGKTKIEPIMKDIYMIEKIGTLEEIKEIKSIKAKERMVNYEEDKIITKSISVQTFNFFEEEEQIQVESKLIQVDNF